MKKIILYFIGLLLLHSSCTGDFEEMNLDPNRPTDVFPGVMLDQLQYRLVNSSIGRARGFSHELMQMTAPRLSINNGLHRYFVEPNNSSGFWDNHYRLMTDAEDIYKIAEKLDAKAYMGVALILKTWSYSLLTDAFGDIPYTEANRVEEGIVKPIFDTQKDIYINLLQNLELANELLSQSSTFVYGGDLIYQTDGAAGILKWRKLANSLRLRMLLRILSKDGELNVRQQLEMILSDGAKYPVFTSNSDDAILRYPGNFPFFNPYFNARTLDWREGTYYTEYFINWLNRNNDPRRTVWATTVNENGQRVYKGIMSGYPSNVEYTVNAHSSYRDELKTLPELGIVMTHAEVELIKSELALRGFYTGGTTELHYQQGIEASMEQWGVEMPSNYLDQEDVKIEVGDGFDAKLEKIIQQKYFAHYFNDFQSWFEKRRTGYPILPRGTGIPVENIFPSRITYPNYLQALNQENLEIATTRMGGDTQNTKVWWEK
ncbi:SusD/RagB family nutrient-binding outer membrane lipoprotein [Belliella sp. R4-6]|uniref:SusD/RagB family nutrient-binding outer membrane lipoprotein n=1 Tax=Belliella alkalica TaxID=1730871 RepID=A0ABS9V6H8_9BACT|nr:SusD/RagB family nutrient-binding outer membrane lipoprotein [Belliella alkalica]MCH7412016.1 SusD/RagB family nutrient-binding outer membrane lipoprotein [Belliella alkalica]